MLPRIRTAAVRAVGPIHKRRRPHQGFGDQRPRHVRTLEENNLEYRMKSRTGEKCGLAIVGHKVYDETQGLRVSASIRRLACTNWMVKIRMNRRDDERRVAVDGAG